MSDIDIRSGGLVAVDTESLRAAANVLSDLRDEVVQIAAMLRGSALRMGSAPDAFGPSLEMRAWRLSAVADDLTERPERLADWLRETAAMYEIVELLAERAAAEAAGDAASIARIDARIAAIDGAHPMSSLRATAAEIWRGATWQGDLAVQFAAGLSAFGPMAGGAAALAAWGFAATLRTVGSGRVGGDAQLRGTADPVRLKSLAPENPTATAPSTLTAAVTRIPDGQARIRVERYAMPDGSKQFAVYIAGTRGAEYGGPDPFDWESNLELYAGDDATSYRAVVAALTDAGAEAGDVVHAVGHSQGALVAAHLATESGYDVRTLVGVGSPIETAVGSDTLSVMVRHTDDPVAALAGGGYSGTVGAPGSFVAERTFDPSPGVHDLALGAHRLEGYAETVALLDDSTDPRMDAVRARLAELSTATSVEVSEYDARRISPSGADAG